MLWIYCIFFVGLEMKEVMVRNVRTRPNATMEGIRSDVLVRRELVYP